MDAPVRTLLVTSSIPGEGKTTTAANLAVVFAQDGRRTILLDADFRKPGVHRIFDLPNASGLSSLMRSDEIEIDACRPGHGAGEPAGHHDRAAAAQSRPSCSGRSGCE